MIDTSKLQIWEINLFSSDYLLKINIFNKILYFEIYVVYINYDSFRLLQNIVINIWKIRIFRIENYEILKEKKLEK